MAITKLSVSTVKNGLLKSNKIWDQTSTFSNVATNSYFPIASYTVPSTAQASITFAGIPQTFSHLQIRGTARSSNGSAGGDSISVSLNGNTTYRSHYLYGEGSGSAAAGSDTIRNYVGRAPSASDTASVYGSFVCDILDYKDVNKYKTGRSLFGFDLNGSGNIYLTSFLYQDTAAVTSLTFTIYGGYLFNQHTNISIYGVN
jgi:hypothetical protein